MGLPKRRKAIEHKVGSELQGIREEIRRENMTDAGWPEVEGSDRFQMPHYNGGFDATDMHFAFTAYVSEKQFCFSISLSEAIANRRRLNPVSSNQTEPMDRVVICGAEAAGPMEMSVRTTPVVEVGVACIFGFEAQGSLLVNLLAEQVEAISGERDIVRRKRVPQPM